MRFRIHHVALSVADLDASTAFYSELGFAPVLDWEAPGGTPRIRHLKLGDTILKLFWFADSWPAPESAARLETDLPRLGVKHFALEVESIGAARDFIRARGWARDVEVVAGRTGVTYFFVPDPDGNLLEFVEDRRDL